MTVAPLPRPQTAEPAPLEHASLPPNSKAPSAPLPVQPQRTGSASHWKDCHFADALSPSLLKHLLKLEGGHNDSHADG